MVAIKNAWYDNIKWSWLCFFAVLCSPDKWCFFTGMHKISYENLCNISLSDWAILCSHCHWKH